MYLIMKDEIFIDKFMKILEEISNIIKHKLNGELIDNKKYLKTKIISTQKKPFNVLIYQSY